MKFSYNWLNEYFDGKLPPANEVATKVGLHSFELESVEKLGNGDFIINWDVLYRMDNVKFDDSFKTSDMVNLNILDANKDKEKVQRATKRMALDVKIGSSPDWLKKRLESMGQKSINNVVDITNYVMFVTGQPVHAFDLDKLAGDDVKNIYIKHAKDGEKIKDLTGLEYQLDSSVLVVADEEKSLDIAGVKGGEISGVDENTKNILMSACVFEYENIRNTSKKLKLQTDASKRYENEVPLHKVDMAQKQFGYLLQELAGARVSEDILDSKDKLEERKEVFVSLKEINSLLGISIKENEVLDIFRRLGFETKIDKDVFGVTPTKERLDINIKQDLIEEIGRIYGYKNIEESLLEEGFNIATKNILKESIRKTGDILVSLGFFEVYNRTIVKKGLVSLVNSSNTNATQLKLRNNLLYILKEKSEKNLIYNDEPKLFEIGKIFTGIKDGKVEEFYSFAGFIAKRKIKDKQKAGIFYQTKGYLEKVFENLSLKNISWKNVQVENEEGFVAEVSVDGKSIGKVGLNFWEINMGLLVEGIDDNMTYKKPSKYPKIDRDVSFFVPEEYTVKEAKNLISSKLTREAINLGLFDIYEDKENNRKSFGFRIVFQSDTETLSDEFVNEKMDIIYKALKKEGFEIR